MAMRSLVRPLPGAMPLLMIASMTSDSPLLVSMSVPPVASVSDIDEPHRCRSGAACKGCGPFSRS